MKCHKGFERQFWAQILPGVELGLLNFGACVHVLVIAMDDLHLEEDIRCLKPDDRTTMLVEVLAFDSEQHNHIMRSAIYGQIFALSGQLREDVSVYLIIGAKIVSTNPRRMEIDQHTAVCPRPPIKLTDIPKVIELCAGIGCLGVGLKHAGMEIVLLNDISQPISERTSVRRL